MLKKFSPLTAKEFWLITLGFIIWRLLIAGVALIAGENLPDTGRFHYQNLEWSNAIEEIEPNENKSDENRYNQTFIYKKEFLDQIFAKTANFDGVHYLTIADTGYLETNYIQAFFPVYPLIIKIIHQLTNFEPLIIGLVISNLATWGFFLLFYQLLKTNFSGKVAIWSLLALACWPTSFYLGMIYNESLFLLLLLGAIILYQKKKWWWLAVILFLLTASRVTGIILIGALAIDLFWQTFFWPKISSWQSKLKSDKKTTSEKKLDKSIKKSDLSATRLLESSLDSRRTNFWPAFFSLCVGALGLITYMIFLKNNFDDPFYFMTVQSAFGAGRETDHLILLPQVFWRYGKIIVNYFQTGQGLTLSNWPYWQELLLSLVAGVIIFWQLWQLISLYSGQKSMGKIDYKSSQISLVTIMVIFSLGAYLVPTLTGVFSSMPRYLLTCLSIFWWFGMLKPKTRSAQVIWLLLSLGLLGLNVALFTQGYWVA